MLYEIAKEIQARLDERGYPLKIRFDEDGFDRVTNNENLALIGYSDAGDDFAPPMGPGQNSKVVLRCDTGFEIHVIGVSTRAGARPHDHKRVATHHRNAVLCELVSVLQARKNAPANLKGGFVAPTEGTTSEYGARYIIAGSITIGIARPAVDTVAANTLGGVETTTAITSPELDTSTETCITAPAA